MGSNNEWSKIEQIFAGEFTLCFEVMIGDKPVWVPVVTVEADDITEARLIIAERLRETVMTSRYVV